MNWLGFRIFVVLCAVSTLAIARADAQKIDLVKAPDNFPQYELSNLRFERSILGGGVAFDWKRVKTGDHTTSVKLSGRNGTNRIRTTSFRAYDGSVGTERLRSSYGSGGLDNVQFWLEIDGFDGISYLVSNIIGKTSGPALSARSLTREEIARRDDLIIATTPPSYAPAGYKVARRETKLVAGARVKAGWRGDWEDAEVLAVKGSLVTVRYENLNTSLRVLYAPSWIAIDPATSRAIAAGGDQFMPSARAVPGTTQILPDDMMLLSDVDDPPAGMPVQYVEAVSFKDATFIGLKNGKAELKTASFGRARFFEKEIIQVVVSEEVAAKLDDQNFRQGLAKNTKLTDEELEKLSTGYHKFRGDRPAGYSEVPAGVLIPEGTRLQVFYINEWKNVTSLADSTGELIPITWDDYSRSRDCRAKREDLAISDEVLAQKIKPGRSAVGSDSATTVAASGDPGNINAIQTWKDNTGRFTLQARYVGIEGRSLRLETADGKTVLVPIAKLSIRSRQMAQKFYREGPANPFAFE